LEEVINDYISDADSEPIQESYDKHNMPYLSKKTKKKMFLARPTGEQEQEELSFRHKVREKREEERLDR